MTTAPIDVKSRVRFELTNTECCKWCCCFGRKPKEENPVAKAASKQEEAAKTAKPIPRSPELDEIQFAEAIKVDKVFQEKKAEGSK